MILNFQPVFAEEKNVDFKMEKLTIDKIDTFFDYFERIGFTDHIDFSMCYCLESHISEKEDETLDTKEKRQRKVIELINENRLSGYLIYANQNLIGWCNADDKTNYEPIVLNEEYQTIDLAAKHVMVIYCIEIAPNFRGKGLSHLIVETICDIAQNEAFAFIEAYPFKDKSFAYQYHGPVHLYEQHRFKMIAEKSYFYIMQRKL